MRWLPTLRSGYVFISIQCATGPIFSPQRQLFSPNRYEIVLLPLFYQLQRYSPHSYGPEALSEAEHIEADLELELLAVLVGEFWEEAGYTMKMETGYCRRRTGDDSRSMGARHD